ncbi:hypothetical protein [Rhodohalobacter sp. 614A]|uniref:hypothetical protein n=1 Tax=Rhodohalobacter sp. 614A TaxID=2908649 RepID=UPI001F2060D9|nr:hypothetical protein [Rhodohalobacter sp. 614A]
MNIISNYSRDAQTDKPKPGSYEWWYFDAQSVDGYKIVVIFYEGNPFSSKYIHALQNGGGSTAEKYPAVSISVYQESRPVFYSFREVEPEQADFSSEMPFGKIDKCSFQGINHQARIEYKIELDQELSTGDSIRASLLFSNDIQSIPKFKSSGKNRGSHEWNLVLPSCHVLGEIKIDGYEKKEIAFNGLGYHDHNTGFEPLKKSFKEWYWGRYHLEDSTFIYYLMNRGDSWENRAWIIDKNGSLFECEDVEISSYSLSLFGFKSARVIECKAGDVEIFVQLDQVLDNGPFYQRFGGRLLLKNESGISESRGISEYIRPARIHQKIFRPLVNMRITYPGKIHWVQKNPHLYRWTW